MAALRTLIEAVEAGGKLPPLYGNNDLYDLIAEALGTRDWMPIERVTKAYNGSVDAALALMEAVLPGVAWSLCNNADGDFEAGVQRQDDEHNFCICEFSDTPARALLLAILTAMEATNARIAQEGKE